ncbi:hypothetical protein SUGI_1120330 [Cryptomeria japonica]|nr:hypothetical protein SUGI_1120330 [Cryptomeria japonica]
MSMRVRMNNESSSLYAANIPGTIPSHALPSPCKLLSVGQDFDGTHNVSISQKDEAWKELQGNSSVTSAGALYASKIGFGSHARREAYEFVEWLEEGDNHYWLMKLEDIMTTCVLGDRFCFVETGNDMQISAIGRSFESKYAANMVAQTIKQDDITSFYTGSTLPVQRAMIVTISELALYA